MKKILLLLLFVIGCAPVTSQPKSSWDKINYYDVPGIVSITTGWGRSHLCTGNLITPEVVLTAAHCLGIPSEDLYIAHNCNDISGNCSRIGVKQEYFHPWYHKEYVSSHDLGILLPLEPITAIQPVTLYFNDRMIVGTSVLASGFGRRFGGSGVLYAGMVRVVRDYSYEVIAGHSGWNDPNPGDSGGPIFALENGEMRLAGILSRSIINDSDRSGTAIYTKPQEYQWVKDVINARQNGTTPEAVLEWYEANGDLND